MNHYCTICGEITTKKNDSCYLCEAGHENWVNPPVGSVVFIVKDNAVLYGVRSKEPGKGNLDLPGGIVEISESAEQIAIRETKEELGIDITLTAFLGTYPTTYDDRPILNLVFIAKVAGGYIVPGDDMSGGDPAWREMNDLPDSAEGAAEWFAQAQKDLLVWLRQD